MSDQNTALGRGTENSPWTIGADQSMQPFVSFDISRKALTGRLIKNKVFGIPTLGFYRFWGKTHIRRLLWQAIKIGDDRVEYHGTAKELFIGFLIGLVILSGLFFGFGIILQLAVLGNPEALGLEQFLNFILLYGFWQFARYRLWRYRLSRTSLRTIRFFLQGKALTYTGKTLLWSVASVLTLGWAYPSLRAVQADYQWNNVAFGDQNFRYQGKVSRFYALYWPPILFSQFILAASIGYASFSSGVDFMSLTVTEAFMASFLAREKVLLLLVGGGLISFLLMVVARVGEFRYITGSTQFAGARFTSSLPAGRMLLIFAGLALIVILGIIGVSVLIWAASLDNSTLVPLFAFLMFFVFYFVFDIVKFLFLVVPMIRVICETLTTDKVDVFEEVATSAENSPKYGEGLADALDVGAF